MEKATKEKAEQALIQAFERFQRQCEALEDAHRELQERLNSAERSLEEKNRELAVRVIEVENGKEKLSGILESITDAVFLARGDGEVEIANRAGKKLLEEGLTLGTGPATVSPLKALLEGPLPVKDADIAVTLADGERAFMVSIIPLQGNPENGGGLVICAKDVTEHRRLEKRVATDDRLAALGRVAASVAHEIRNPLAGIEGFASLLDRDLGDQPGRQRLARKTVYAARQLNHVISNLLAHTRETRCSLAVEDIRPAMERAIELVRPIAEDRQIALVADLPDSPTLTLLDPAIFQQVINNLLVNAMDACPVRANGRIEISVRRRGDMTVLTVTDNGRGIPKRALRAIFEPFFTLKEGGIGLGLALCERIVKAHGGEIQAESVEGQGATFRVTLKAAENAQ